MAQTLKTAERRLGVDPDEYIIYYALCSKCWEGSRLNKIDQLNGPHCPKDGCNRQLYTSKTLSNGRVKRVPTRVLSCANVEKMLGIILMKPGKMAELQHWRVPGKDEPGRVPPMAEPLDGYDAFADLDVRLFDVYDGWVWRTIQAGLERRRHGAARWGVEDVDVRELNQRFVSLPCGLLLCINIDW